MTQTAKNASAAKSDQAASNSARSEQTTIETSDGLETADFGLLLKNQSLGGAAEPPPSPGDTILRQLQSADSAALNRKVLRLQKTVGNKSVSRLLTEYQIRRRFAANLHLPDLAGTAKDFKDNAASVVGNAGETATASVQNAVSDKLINPAVETVQNAVAPVLDAKDQAAQVVQTVSDGIPAPAADVSSIVVAAVPAAAPAQAKFEQAKATLEQVQQVKTPAADKPTAEVTAKTDAVPQAAAEVAAAPAATPDAAAVAKGAEAQTPPTKDPQLAQAAKGKPEDGVKEGDLVAPAGPVTAPKEADDAAGFAELADQPEEEIDLEKPFKVPGFGEGAEVARTIQRAVDSSLEPPKITPVRAPDQDPAFVAVKQKTKAAAKQEQAHEPAKSKVDEAKGAAVPPGNEVSSQAGANQVGKMNQQEAGSFDVEAFVAAVRKAVEAITPKSEDEADKFKESGKAGEIKGQVAGMVGESKEKAQKDIDKTANEAPDTSAVKPKQVTPMQAEKPGDKPGAVGAENGMPKPKDAAESSLEYGPNQINKQMTDAKVTEEQLQKSNEPTFKAAADEKKKVEQEAATKPDKFRQDEKALLDQTKGEAKTQAGTALDTMHTDRTAAFTQVGGDKDQTKSKDEEVRTKLAADLDGIYKKTKDDVTKILDELDGKVDAEFDKGEKEVRADFENYVKQRMDAYKDERYGGLFGWANRVVDAFAGMPPEVNAFYTDGRNRYLSGMDNLIRRIGTNIVGKELQAAKSRIASGMEESEKVIKEVAKKNPEIAREATETMQERYAELKSSVDEKQSSIVDNLAQKYSEATKAVDERIKAMQEENKGLVAKAVDAVKGVIETILELKNMLLGVLARAAAAIEKIIQDPIGFLSNLLNAIKGGLRQFVSNIGTHLQAGLISWLTGTLGEAGLKMPAALDLRGILDLVLQILGLTWQNIRTRLVKATSEVFVTRLEKAAEVIMILINEGPVGLWKYIQEQAENMKNQVIEGIKEWVISKVIQAGVSWLVSLFNPAGAFIAAARAIIAVVQFLMERGSQIMSFVNSILDSVEAIASGSIGGAANAIEQSLAKALPLAISFLANLLGLGGISGKIKNIIAKVQKPVNNAIDKVIKFTLTKFKSLFKKEDTEKHKKIAGQVATELGKPDPKPRPYKVVEPERKQKATQLETQFAAQLQKPNKIDIKFAEGGAKAAESGKLEFTVNIGPEGKASKKGFVKVLSKTEEAKQEKEKALKEAQTMVNSQYNGKMAKENEIESLLSPLKSKYKLVTIKAVEKPKNWGLEGVINRITTGAMRPPTPDQLKDLNDAKAQLAKLENQLKTIEGDITAELKPATDGEIGKLKTKLTDSKTALGQPDAHKKGKKILDSLKKLEPKFKELQDGVTKLKSLEQMEKDIAEEYKKLKKVLDDNSHLKRSGEQFITKLDNSQLKLKNKLKSPTALKRATAISDDFTALKQEVLKVNTGVSKFAKKGEQADPFDLDWPKPAAVNYPTLYFGGKLDDVKSQSELAANVGKKDANGEVIKAYSPTSKQALPGGPTIGIDSTYQVSVGMIVGPVTDDETPGGGAINKVLNKYGYSADDEGMDGDHVLEIQMGGKDVLGNLWPLNAGMNRGAGSTLGGASFTDPDTGLDTRMSELKANKTRKFYFKITKTR